MVVSSLGFLLVFYVPDLELKKLETRNANVHRHKKKKPRPTLSNHKTKKGVA